MTEPWTAFAQHQVSMTTAPDGSVDLENVIPLPPSSDTLIDRLSSWAVRAPDRVFLSERRNGEWESLTYEQVWIATGGLGRRLLALGLSAERPLMVVAPNSIAHALLVLAAMRIGVPSAIVSPALAANGPSHRLRDAYDLLTPGAIYVESQSAAETVRGLSADLIVLGSVAGAADPHDLPIGDEALFRAAEARVSSQTIAKFLFTSGSTGAARAVPNTHRMMISNMDGLALTWPFLNEVPPRLLDWLPWSHTFGGNCCFNLALNFGGTFNIDNGKPTADLIGETVRNLNEVAPNLYFNVPAGYAALLPYLEGDDDMARRFLGGLKFLFNAGAAMPRSTRERLEAVAARVGVMPLRVLGGWGSTETAPFSTVIYFPTRDASNIGVPMPGVTVRMVPQGPQMELRVRGPNVTEGYWRTDNAAVFDSEGFYCIGDAGRLADPQRPHDGIVYDGRLAENFKLASGTWVNVGAVRLAVVAATAPLVADVVITGHDSDGLGALVFPDLARCRALFNPTGRLDDSALCADPALTQAVTQAMAEHNLVAGGATRQIGRFLLMSDPLKPEAGEITDKGHINQRLVLARRAEQVEALARTGHLVPTHQGRPAGLGQGQLECRIPLSPQPEPLS